MANKFLDLYNEWRKDKVLPSAGLCNALPYDLEISEAWKLTRPDYQERDILVEEGYDYAYWGSGLESDHKDEERGFTPLRQTIMLICAALNGEFD